MRHLIFSLFFVLLAFACNRPASVAVAEPPRTAPIKPSPEEMALSAKIEMGPETGESDGLSRNQPTTKADGSKAAPTLIAELRRTPCYGKCPAYTIQILSDYSLRYVGSSNVDLLGTYTGKLTNYPMTVLGPLTSSVRFFNMEKQYPVGEEMPSDLPFAVTTIHWKGRSNTVKSYSGSEPAGLLEIQKILDGFVEQAIWIPAPK